VIISIFLRNPICNPCIFVTVTDYKKIPAMPSTSDSLTHLQEGGVSCALSTSSYSTVDDVATASVINADVFNDIFRMSNLHSWQNICVDPLLTLPNSYQGHSIVDYAKILTDRIDFLEGTTVYESLKNMFCERSLSLESDREGLMVDVQSLRMSLEANNVFYNVVCLYIPSANKTVCKQLFQVWLRKIVIAIIGCIATHVKTVCSKTETTTPLSDVAQNILFHICGYMIMKVKRVCKRFKKLQKLQNFCDHLGSREPLMQGHFVDKYQQWVEKQSRGGLMFPIPALYLMIREFDVICQTIHSSNPLQISSICKDALQAAMHDSSMVKYYWGQILQFDNVDELSALPIFDYLVSLFITIKGFAIARKERDKLSAAQEQKLRLSKSCKSSKSLRGKLKQH